MNTFKTTDFYLAVALRAKGFEMTMVKLDHKKFEFHFEKITQKVVSDYWNRRLQVDARTYNETITELKTRMYDQF